MFARDSNHYSLYLIEANLVPAAVVKLRRARVGMVGHVARLLKRAAILEVRGDAGAPEGVVTDLGGDAGVAAHRLSMR